MKEEGEMGKGQRKKPNTFSLLTFPHFPFYPVNPVHPCLNPPRINEPATLCAQI